jgi:hypothetical protein
VRQRIRRARQPRDAGLDLAGFPGGERRVVPAELADAVEAGVELVERLDLRRGGRCRAATFAVSVAGAACSFRAFCAGDTFAASALVEFGLGTSCARPLICARASATAFGNPPNACVNAWTRLVT